MNKIDSSLIENIVEAAKKVPDKKNEKLVTEKEKAIEVLKRFKHPKHKEHVKKHIEHLEKGKEPKKVLVNFFNTLRKKSSSESYKDNQDFLKDFNEVKECIHKVFEIIKKPEWGEWFKTNTNGTIIRTEFEFFQGVELFQDIEKEVKKHI
jgi:preprotein translocase subunit Sss1